MRKRRLLDLVDEEHVAHATRVGQSMGWPEDWWSVCGRCGQTTQFAHFGLRAHTFILHAGKAALHDTFKEPQWNKSSSSTPSRPDLTVVSSSTTDGSLVT